MVSIVIVSHNSAGFLQGCCRSIDDHSAGRDVDVIVVDNASTDGSVALLKKDFPRVKVIENKTNDGFAAANNKGIRASRGEYVLLLNPDTRFESDVVQGLLDVLAGHPRAAAAGPKILNADGSIQRTGVSFPTAWNLFAESLFLDSLLPYSKIFGRHRRKYDNPGEIAEVEYVQGSCLMLKRGPLEELGLLDEQYFMYFEETDLAYRLMKNGWKTLYAPVAEVTHFGGGGAAWYSETRLVQYHRSFLLFLRKNYSWPRRILIVAGLLWRSLVRVVVFLAAYPFAGRRRNEFLERAGSYVKVLKFLSGVG